MTRINIIYGCMQLQFSFDEISIDCSNCGVKTSYKSFAGLNSQVFIKVQKPVKRLFEVPRVLTYMGAIDENLAQVSALR